MIHPPVYGPHWIIGAGCCSDWNAHRAVVWPVNGAIRVPEHFAIDFAQLSPTYSYLEGPEDQLSSFPSFGAEVHSATAGTVITVRDDVPETPAGTLPHGLNLEQGGGNKVVIAIGHGRYAFYAHFRFTEFNLVGKSTSVDLATGQVTIDTTEHGIRRDELPLDEQVVDFP